jgi:hypothetical protein
MVNNEMDDMPVFPITASFHANKERAESKAVTPAYSTPVTSFDIPFPRTTRTLIRELVEVPFLQDRTP